MAKKGRVMGPGSTKRPRPWSERADTPTKFRAGVAGPGCICCRARNDKRLRRHIMRRREAIDLAKEER